MKKSPLVAETGASADCDERFAKGSRGYSGSGPSGAARPGAATFTGILLTLAA